MVDFALKIKNPIHQADWDDWLGSTHSIGFFHTSSWARVLVHAYRYRPVYFALCKQNRPAALLPVMAIDSPLTGKRGVSLPFTDACPAIAEREDQFQALFNYAVQYAEAHRWRSLAIRTDSQWQLPPPAWPSCRYIRHCIKLGDNRQITQLKIRKSTLRNAKRAHHAGVRVTTSHTVQSVRVFYRLNCLTRKHHGLPPQPWYFFEAVFENIIKKRWGNVFLAYYQDRPIAGAIFFNLRPQAHYKYGASNRKYQHLRANNLVMLEAIQHYHREGFRTIDLGRTELNHEGLRQYKRGWGTEEDYLHYYLFDINQKKYVTEEHSRPPGYGLLKLLPVSILRLIGYLIYPHVG